MIITVINQIVELGENTAGGKLLVIIATAHNLKSFENTYIHHTGT